MKILKLVSVFVAVLSFAACTKDEKPSNSGKLDDKVISEQVIAESASASFAYPLSMASEKLQTKAGQTKSIVTFNETYPVITIDFEHLKVTIDFGTTGVLCPDGSTRSGVLTVTASALQLQAGVVYTVTSSNYKVNGFLVTGTITNTALKVFGNFILKSTINEDIVITYPNQQATITRKATFTREISTDLTNLTVSIFGSATIVGTDGVKRTQTVAESTPLIYSVNANEVVKGIMILQIEGSSIIWTIDFGDGTPDKTYTISNGTNTWTVTEG